MSDNVTYQGETKFNTPPPTAVITFREFTSPHHYNYNDCMMKDGKAYQCKILEGVSGFFDARQWTDLGFAPDGTLSPALVAILNGLQLQIDINTKEILRLNNLLALLIFELLEQGIEMSSKELNEELETYIKNIT